MSSWIAVIDTNFLLGSVQLKDIDWRNELGCSDVALIVCMTVVRQLDRQKAPRLRDRARTRLAQIESADGTEIAPQVTLTIDRNDFRDQQFPTHLSPNIEDDRILLHALNYAADSNVVLVTRDAGLRIKAKAAGLQVLGLDQYADEPTTTEQESELRKLRTENAALRDQMPRLRVECTIASSHKISDARHPYTLQSQAPLLEHEKQLREARELRDRLLHGQTHQLALGVGFYDAHRFEADWDNHLGQLDTYLRTENKRRQRASLAFPLRVALRNDGRVAAEAIQVQLRYPPDKVRPRDPSIFIELNRPAQPKVMVPDSYSTDEQPLIDLPQKLLPHHAGAPIVDLAEGSWIWSITMLRPGDEVEIANWAMQFRTLAKAGPFALSIRISARNLPKPILHNAPMVIEK